MADALEEAALRPEQIDYINPHGSSTPINDRNETTAIRAVFDGHAGKVLVSATKGYTGHPLGATGAIEAGIVALALQKQHVPANLGLRDRDPECDLNLAAQGGPATLENAISNSFGFGGINATIVLKRFP
jgi:3-oxoacyl-[acyl-carrier-protein] synthase II